MAENTDSGREARIWGPPGCGKTTYLSRQIRNAAEKYGSKRVLVTSFTRAAATELVGRNLPLPKGTVGTLHSHCYRALGHPNLADTHRDEWNREHTGLRLSPTDETVDEIAEEHHVTGLGDELYGKLQILRAQGVRPELWPPRVQRFADAWASWKRKNNLMDFTDLLEIGLKDLKSAPGDPAVIVVDEAQDLSQLQLALLRQWGRHADHLVMAADDDQTIYGFAGAAPEVLLAHQVPESFRTVLKQSYRVPRAVHALSQAWIQGVSLREPKEYLPRDADGEVRILHKGHYNYPEPVVDDAERYVDAGRTVMLLATCSYMLEPLKQVLRKRGLPFHNPYRLKRADWNPLAPPERLDEHVKGSRPRSLTAAERLRAYLRPRPEGEGADWSPKDLLAWTAWLRGEGILAPSAEHLLKHLPPDVPVGPEELKQLFPPNVLAGLNTALSFDSLPGCIRWWLDRLKPPRRRTAEYPARVVVRGGVAALRERPKIIIGTGHSVKGGEADVVYLFPDLSPSAAQSWEGRPGERDTVRRLGYVMMTRAREALVICQPVGPYQMPVGRLAATA